jgi:hypothetical protein
VKPNGSSREHWSPSQAEKLVDAGVYMPASPTWACLGCAYGKACREAYVGKAAA